MRQAAYIIAALLLLTGCAATKKVPAEVTDKKDSTRTEIRYERIVEWDTCYIEIERQAEKNVTKEKHSHLENDYASSDASIDSLGLLHHSLETKPQKKPVPVPATTERRDSIIYKEQVVYKEKPVYVERDLTWTQQAQIYGFRLLIALAALGIIINKRKTLLALIRRLIP